MSPDYVLGLAYAPRSSKVATTAHVLLLRKAKPKWQEGFLNGVGGKIEVGETIAGAMAREFREETGISTLPHYWTLFHQERYEGGQQGLSRVFFLHTVCAAEDLRAAVERTALTPEPCSVHEVASSTGSFMTRSKNPVMYNIRYLLAMSRTFMHLGDELPVYPVFDVDPYNDRFPLRDPTAAAAQAVFKDTLTRVAQELRRAGVL